MTEKDTRQGRSNTRRRIQEVALKLFAERGYEKTSLREIAEALQVTKPAIYYHYQSKEEILESIFQGVGRPVAEAIEWARGQSRTLETKRELLRRYEAALNDTAPLFHFLRQNEATLRDLQVGKEFNDQMTEIGEFLTDSGTPLTEQLRCMGALLTLHFGTFALPHFEGDTEEKRSALLSIATEMMERAQTPQE
ncbi:TetR/AcrR family transcriptional regulator [Streptomyces sp. NPDC059850]|uniref:TetR/AcrR family transcriptional regulator n=1 Tax=Streptomyces sp. NPDC059850 TaxID=3346970 RepID=UPI003661A234